MTNKEYEAAMKKVRYENQQKKYKENLKAARYKGKKRAKMPTSKKVLWVVVLLCLQILFFSEFCAIKFSDTSFLYALIGVPTTLIPAVISYMNKSKAENTGPNGEGITWQSMMNEQQNNYTNHFNNDDSMG